MKTKNIILFFLTLILGFVLTHCSTYTVKKDMSIKGELTKTPKWYVKHDREDKKWMYETSVSVSPDLELAVKKSILLAKAKLADRINGKMNNRSTITKSENGQNETMVTSEQAEDAIVNMVSDTIVRDYIVEKVEIFYTHHKSYRAYVKIKVSKKNVKNLIDEIKTEKQLKIANKKPNNINKVAKEVLNSR